MLIVDLDDGDGHDVAHRFVNRDNRPVLEWRALWLFARLDAIKKRVKDPRQ